MGNLFRNTALFAACFGLAAGVADAKPGKGKGKGGPPGHSEKGKGGGKPDDKGKPDKGQKDISKQLEKERKEIEKDFDKADKADEKRDKEIAKWREKAFRDEEKAGVIRYFSGYRDNEYGLPPGLAKNLRRGKPLPPGWQKKIYGGEVIGDDLWELLMPVEYGLFPGLNVIPDTRLYLLGDRLVRVYEPRREVVDYVVVPTIRLD